MYKLINFVSPQGINFQMVEKLFNNSFIPFDPANNDYQAYLEWVAEGNTPLPADNTEA